MEHSIVLAWRNFGPYHEARKRALDTCGRISTLELSTVDRVYGWHQKQRDLPDHHVVFGADPSAASVAHIRRQTWDSLDVLSPTVVFVPGWGHYWSRTILHWCIRNERRAVLMSDSNADDFPRRYLSEMIKRRIVMACDAGFVAGKRSRKYLALLGMPEEMIVLGYDVVDNMHFSRSARVADRTAGPASSDSYFLAVGRFVPKKNFEHLLLSYSDYRRAAGLTARRLVILGDGPERTSICGVISKLDLNSYVDLPGFIQYDDLPAWYRGACCLVHPSTSEQWGLVVNEAMSAGLPVLVSERCGCVPDLVEEGQNGFSFDPLDRQQLAQLLLRASNSPKLASMGARSREIVSSWGLDKFASGVEIASRLAMSAPKRPTPVGFGALLSVLDLA